MYELTTNAAFGKAYEMAKEMGLLKKLWAKLLGDPNAAAQQLAIALFEVRRTFDSLRNALLEISHLGVPGQNLVDIRRALDRIESGQLFEEVIRAKGSCGKIGNIYDQHLQAWFKEILVPTDQDRLREDFNTLRDSDRWAIDAMEHLIEDAKPLAREIRVLFDNGKEAEAHRAVKAFLQEFLPIRDKLSATISHMLALEAKFIQERRLT
jgi:hypothetical protein